MQIDLYSKKSLFKASACSFVYMTAFFFCHFELVGAQKVFI